MTPINYGNGNHTNATLTADGDVIIFGDGQGDALSLTGNFNTFTFGNGDNDLATVTGANNMGTFGKGNYDTATVTGANNKVTFGQGNGDGATLIGSFNTATLGDGNNDTATVSNSLFSKNRVTLGDGNNDTVTVSGSFAYVTLGQGHGDSVTVNNNSQVEAFLSYPGDTIDLTNSVLNLFGANEMVFLGAGNSTVTLPPGNFTGTQLNVQPATGDDLFHPYTLVELQTTVIDLKGGIGGFTSVTGPDGVLNALQDDGSGGTLLAFGPGSSLDITNFAPSLLTAANFKIG